MIKCVFLKEKMNMIDTYYEKHILSPLAQQEVKTSSLLKIDLAEFERTGGIS